MPCYKKNSKFYTFIIRHLFYAALFIFSTINIACEHPYSFDYYKTNDTIIVVEGMITNENKNHYIYLSHLSGYNDTLTRPITHAFIAVTSNDSTFYYKEDSLNPGQYYSQNPFVGVTGNTYNLHVEVGKKIYTAHCNMLPVTPPDSITFTHHKNGLLSINYVAQSLVTSNPAMYQLQLNWNDVEGYKNLPYNQASATMYYYSLTTVDISQLFIPKIQTIYFPEGTRIIERKYSLNNDYELYLRTLLAETQWSGGFFDEAHGNLHTNIDNNAVGYFAACTVYIDTIYAK